VLDVHGSPSYKTMSDRPLSKVLRFHDHAWSGVPPRPYKDEPGGRWSGVTRHPLLGAAEGLPFHVRYFEVRPGGHTSLERHDHQHAVIVIRGRGAVRLGDCWEDLEFGDAVYVAGADPHQFRAAADEPLGFICVVDAERDRPVPLED
jgi:ribulose-bisphosphate carboxylase large chain